MDEGRTTKDEVEITQGDELRAVVTEIMEAVETLVDWIEWIEGCEVG